MGLLAKQYRVVITHLLNLDNTNHIQQSFDVTQKAMNNGHVSRDEYVDNNDMHAAKQTCIGEN